jgi:diadenosine tetraphosphatase ApaH/serine/threonine PP2A family protein phosphatase
MEYAIISDIHSNTPALEAVLEDIDSRRIKKIICLGDVVGYGPHPIECADLIMKRCETVICGNHDEALTLGGVGFHQVARDAIQWTKEQLQPRMLSSGATKDRWAFLTKLKKEHRDGSDRFIHGSPRDFTCDYILPGDAAFGRTSKLDEIFDAFDHRLFVGHSHLPMAMTEDCEVIIPSHVGNEYECDPAQKVVINVGSVGQPRDKDPRACYAVVDGSKVTWRRVEYDLMTTVRRIESIERLSGRLAERLITGS